MRTHAPAWGVLVAAFSVVLVVGFGAFGVGRVVDAWVGELPSVHDPNAFAYSAKTRIYANDRTTLLAEFYLQDQEPIEKDQVGDYVLKGTVATEDTRFYEHEGVDYYGIGRALVNNLNGGSLEGASTITQQLVRNTLLSSEANDISFRRKVREAELAIEMEQAYSKDDILLMYLNTINYGSGCYGIEAAAQHYFSKSAIDLTLAEAATLVGIPQSPTYNNPINYPENCTKRRNVVLDRMLSNGVITQEEHDAAQAEPLVLNPTEPSTTGIEAYPYFTSYVRDQLTNANGKYAYSKDELFKGGLKVYTTLDVSMQEAAEAAAREKEQAAGDNYEVAMVAIDPDNGYIKALVGGKDYDASQVNMATGTGGSGRQAGSSFKTFTLVAAIEQGIDPNTMIDASATAKLPGWEVANINHTNYGTKSIADAFAVSSNTAFARLILSIGPDKVVDVAKRMGITSPLTATGSLTLGSESVTPLEMANAYATIANGGTHYDPECVERIVDRNGSIVVDNSAPKGERAISAEVAHAATEVMKGVITKGTGKAAALSNGQVSAGKTGTSENYMDSWFCGITPQLSVAIWFGDRSDYSHAQRVPSGMSAASTFPDFMNVVLKGKPTEDFPKAGDPQYKSDFKDTQYHIGGYYSSADDEDKDKKSNESSTTENGTNTGSHHGTTGNGGNGAAGGAGGAGGETGGTGGDSSGGTTGGTGGGDSGGGTTGGTGGGDSGGGGGGATEPVPIE